MEGMREIARSYYERASEAEKKSIKQSFAKLDINGDGRISLREFKNTVSSWLCEEAVFKKLDENGDGCLDFEEFLCLHYMEKKVAIGKCSGCSELLVGPYFSCSLCLGRGADTYDLCCACYRCGVGSSHKHPEEHMMDHHSLLMLFRNEKSQKKKGMDELHVIAEAHYRAGSPQVKKLAKEFYESMDTDGDGQVDLSEFIAFMKHEGYSFMQNRSFFDKLDLDNRGTLDFSEVMTLYYIIKSGRPFCGRCAEFIPGIFFSCVECFKNPKTSFHLCCDCYQSADCKHNHDGRSQFLDNYALLQAKRDPELARATGVNSNEARNRHTNSLFPLQHDGTVVIIENAIVPAPSKPNWSKRKAAYYLLDTAVKVGTFSTFSSCTIL